MLSGRIVKGVGGLYTVVADGKSYACKARGIFRKDGITPLIGDFVRISVLDEQEKTGTIEQILERKTELSRPRVSNVDHAVLVFAAVSPDINLDLMDRFIILCELEGLMVSICINKSDMIQVEDYAYIRDVYSKVGYKVLFTSAVTMAGISELTNCLESRTTVFAGPSGAGKSSLINILKPEAAMETGPLSKKISRGKHTTRHAQLMDLGAGGYIIDTPGFTSLYLDALEKTSLDQYFREFIPYVKKCRFRNCSHINEPDCAVKEGVEKGDISQERYQRYVGIYKELDQ